MNKKGMCTLLVLSLNTPVFAEEYFHYQVQKNDYLSNILQSLRLVPIYGKNGYLNEVISLNKGKIKNNGNLIRVGTQLILPLKAIGKDVASSEEVKETTEDIKEAAVVNKVAEPVEPVEPVVINQSTDQYSFFKLSPMFTSLAIESTNDTRFGGTKASNTTQYGVGIRGEWRIVMRPDLSLNTFFSMSSLKFYDDTAYALTDTSFIRTSYGIGGQYGINSVSRIESSLEMNQNYFQDVVTPANIQIRSMSQVELKTQYNRNLFTMGLVKSEWGAGGLLILPSSHGQFKATTGYGFNLDWTTEFRSKEIQVSYGRKFFKVNDITNQLSEILVRLNFSLGYEK
ncbi:hypothetical protein SHI21_15755 [Bacteriovorax sp. PP10]|uniref:LysM domain-containing protein n=1 Tax=Bacteriovorax antarcticus TaxID=3088717 RepID=A0ABU5VX89_9BACT|nr:hypothetical protein [Bacteriovorax sp. PP10]MEA9357685.1 hypothetical protein [Bacteriovorax sp. PP10]